MGSTETTLRRLCDFWGIPWHPALLETDLGRSNSGRWKRDLQPAATAEVERIVEEPLKRLGYA